MQLEHLILAKHFLATFNTYLGCFVSGFNSSLGQRWTQFILCLFWGPKTKLEPHRKSNPIESTNNCIQPIDNSPRFNWTFPNLIWISRSVDLSRVESRRVASIDKTQLLLLLANSQRGARVDLVCFCLLHRRAMMRWSPDYATKARKNSTRVRHSQRDPEPETEQLH